MGICFPRVIFNSVGAPFFGRLDQPQIRSKFQNRPKSGNIFVFPLWDVGTLNLCLLMLVNVKKELVQISLWGNLKN